MAKAPESAGSDPAELKALLKLANSKPVNVAFGLGGDGKVVIKLDKAKNPKALAKALKDADPKIKNLLVGQVSIQPDDASTATFSMNKEAGGMEGKLIVALKGTGISKVQITVASGEAEDDSQDATDGDAEEGAQETAAAPDFSADMDAAPAPASSDAGAPDAGALTAQLTALVKQMMTAIGANPGLKSTLVPMAASAQASLKGGDLQQAAAGIASLQQALAGEGIPAAGEPPLPPPSPPVDPAIAQKLQKSVQIWRATRTKIEADLQKLTKALQDAAKGDDGAEDLEKQLTSAIEPVLLNLDESLSDTLSQAAAATDDGERQKFVQQAQITLGRFQSFVQDNKLLGHLDQNPFVPLAITKTLTTTLSALSATVR